MLNHCSETFGFTEKWEASNGNFAELNMENLNFNEPALSFAKILCKHLKGNIRIIQSEMQCLVIKKRS